MAEKVQKKIKYPTVESMYGVDDLGNDPIFPGGYINYGYWKNIPLLGQLITLQDRVDSQANLYSTMFGLTKIDESDIVLEAACGRGRGLKLLCDTISPQSVYGIDFSPHQVQRSITTLDGTPGDIHVIESPAENLPFDDNTFTKAYSVEAIQHFKSPEMFIKQLGRVVKKDGVVAITSFFATSKSAVPVLTEIFPTIKRGVDNAIDINDIIKWLTESNFKDIDVISIGEYVWKQFAMWCEQVNPQENANNWLNAYVRGLLDYYIITAKNVK